MDGFGVQSCLLQRSLVSLPCLGKAILALQSAPLFGSLCCLYQRKPMTTNDHAHITWRISTRNTLGQARLLGGLVTLEGKGRWGEMVDRGLEEASVFGFSPTCVGRRRKGKFESRTLEAAKKGPWSTARHSRDFFQLFVRRPLTFSSPSLAIVAFVPFLCSLYVCVDSLFVRRQSVCFDFLFHFLHFFCCFCGQGETLTAWRFAEFSFFVLSLDSICVLVR